MKLLTVPALLAAALFSVVVVLPFLPLAQSRPEFFALDVGLASSTAGDVRLYYDVGRGYNETDSTSVAVPATEQPQRIRFTLPAGKYLSLRLDPISSARATTIEGPLRIVSASGREIHTVAASELRPLHQIENLRATKNQLTITPTAAANDPQVSHAFPNGLTLRAGWSERLAGLTPRAGIVFALLVALLFGLDRAPSLRRSAAKAATAGIARPVRSVMLVAAFAVIASAYPIVFLGQSYVSPNYGTTLLYNEYPSLPGFTSTRPGTENGSDVGAMMWQHVPYSFIQHSALARGELPLWNRYNSAGTPLLAQGQSMFGDPLHFFVVLCHGASWAWDAKFMIAKWLFATALGLLVLQVLRHSHGPESNDVTSPSPRVALSAALIVALAAPFVGFFVFRINHPATFSLCYAPWVLCFWLALCRASGRRAVGGTLAGLFVANFALLNSGTVKEAYLLLGQMNVAGVALLLASSRSWRERGLKLLAAAWTGTLVLLASAPVWFTFLRTLPHAFTASSHPAADQIQPSLLLGAFDELFFRHLSRGDIVFNPALNLLLLAGLLYFLATLRLHFPRRPIIALTLVATAFAAVVFGLIPAHIITRLPFLGQVHHIENCFLCGLIILWSVLAGVGFATAATRLPTRAGRDDLIIAGVLLFGLVFAWIGFRQVSHRMVFGPGTTITVVPTGEVIPVAPFIWGFLAAALLAIAIFALVARRALMQRTIGAGSVILVALATFVLLARQGLHAAPVGFERFVLHAAERANFHARSAAVDFLRTQQTREPTRVLGLFGFLTPGWNATYGLETIHGPDALQNPWLRQLIEAAPVSWGAIWRLYLNPSDAIKARPFLDALNVRYYVNRAFDRPELAPAMKLVLAADLDVYESPTAWPRAFFTDRLDTYTDAPGLMQKFAAANGRPLAAIHAEELAATPALAQLPRDIATRTVTPATHYVLTENTTSFTLRANAPGVAVLTEAWWPDAFRVEVNGRRAPVLRLNHAFKGVFLDAAGDYHVKFSYWPRHFLRLLLLSATGFVLAAVSLCFALRPARTA